MLNIDVFPANLRFEMEKRGITQATLADMTGITKSTISLLVTGSNSANLSTAVKIANALGLTLDYLLGNGSISEEDGKREKEKLKILELEKDLSDALMNLRATKKAYENAINNYRRKELE